MWKGNATLRCPYICHFPVRNASRLLNGGSGDVATGASRVTFTVTQSGADVLTTIGEDNALEGKKLLGGETARFSPMRRLHWQFLHY